MELQFVNTNPEHYERELIRAYEQITNRTLYPADPERLVIDAVAYALSLMAFRIDWSAKQNLLAFAEGQHLDALAEFYGVKRLPAQPARTVLKFELSEPLSFDVVIPKGTRATPDNRLFFETTQEARIQAGQISVEVPAVCQTAGSVGNGFAVGQINRLVDVLPYVQRVSNTTESMYGAEPEEDESFRERIRLSIERFSNAGSKEAYIFHTKSVHQDIEDVQVLSPSPGVVHVYFLLKGGRLPDQNMIELVRTHLSADKIRPLTDNVFVFAPEVVQYQVSIQYTIHRKDEAKVSLIQSQVLEAVEDFINWTGRKIGKNILPEELIRRVKEAGAYRVQVISPAFSEIPATKTAKGSINSILYQGLSDD